MKTLAAKWIALSTPDREGVWHAVEITGVARLAKTPSGGVAVVIARHETAPPGYPLETAHVAYRPAVDLEIDLAPGDCLRGSFGVLECLARDRVLVKHFLRIVEMVLSPAALESWRRFDTEVRSVFELFRRLGSQGSRNIHGLWGELLVVLNGGDPQLLVRALHSDPDDLHDFVSGDCAIEVKTTLRALREHTFSLDQLEHRRGRVAVASVMLLEDPFGETVFDLLDRIVARLDIPGLRSRVTAVVLEAIGQAWEEAERLRFALRPALESIRFYSSLDVPSVTTPVPTDVHHVQFVASLESSPELPLGSPTAKALVDAARPVRK